MLPGHAFIASRYKAAVSHSFGLVLCPAVLTYLLPGFSASKSHVVLGGQIATDDQAFDLPCPPFRTSSCGYEWSSSSHRSRNHNKHKNWPTTHSEPTRLTDALAGVRACHQEPKKQNRKAKQSNLCGYSHHSQARRVDACSGLPFSSGAFCKPCSWT